MVLKVQIKSGQKLVINGACRASWLLKTER